MLNYLFTPSDKWGNLIDNLKIHGQPAPYPVVNEREVRAVAGLMLLTGIITFFYTITYRDYTLLYLVAPLFLLDFLLRVLIHPEFSLYAQLSKLLVSNQKPEWVGAIQKRFAWSIGVAMATAMIVVAFFLQIRGPLPFAICLTCLFFMWLESALGICVGCKIYSFLIDKKIIAAPEFKPACPGGACSIKPSK